jgi:hypothetical protein
MHRASRGCFIGRGSGSPGQKMENWKSLARTSPKLGSLAHIDVRHEDPCSYWRDSHTEIEIFEDLTPDQWIAFMMGVDRST